jgi:hypothetical protein
MMRLSPAILLVVCFAGAPLQSAHAQPAPAANDPSGGHGGPRLERGHALQGHADLVALYEEFRAFRLPNVTAGVPDYTAPAMARQFEGLRRLQDRLAALDTAGWSLAEQVDYRIVQAEMRGMEFEHRVTEPWKRDPAFYAVVNFQFGPKMHRAMSLPSLPLEPARIADTRERLVAIPAILDQARGNLTDPVADLATIAIYTTRQQLDRLDTFITRLRQDHPDLVEPARSARTALDSYRDWLIARQPAMRNGAGVGIENYDWWLEHVMLMPYRWHDLLLLSQREYERSMALLKLKEHRNRHTPVLEPVTSRDAFLHRQDQALDHYHRFLLSSELFTVPDYVQPPAPATGAWAREGETDYFQHVLDRYPLPLAGHGRGHTIDALHLQRDDRPIRGQSRLYFVDAVRQEAFAIGKEKFLYDLGLVQDVPRADELMYNLQAFRAARAVADLRMHSNDMTFDEAFQYVVDHTPYGWAPPDSPTLWHDLELYLRAPLYGVGYVIGPIQIERLMTDTFLQRGDAFDLTAFMDEFRQAGLIPMSLISLEMLGREQARLERDERDP